MSIIDNLSPEERQEVDSVTKAFAIAIDPCVDQPYNLKDARRIADTVVSLRLYTMPNHQAHRLACQMATSDRETYGRRIATAMNVLGVMPRDQAELRQFNRAAAELIGWWVTVSPFTSFCKYDRQIDAAARSLLTRCMERKNATM